MLDPKWLDILKASGWNTFAIALGCWIVLYLDRHRALAASMPNGWKLTVVMAAIASSCLCVTSLLREVWINTAWLRRRVTVSVYGYFEGRKIERRLEHLTGAELSILAYLLFNNQPMFVTMEDGGYASTLISKRFIAWALVDGQVYDPLRTPFIVPKHVWKILRRHIEEFPKPDEKKTSLPWVIPWNAR